MTAVEPIPGPRRTRDGVRERVRRLRARGPAGARARGPRRVASAVLTGVLLLAGCGIRATTVPVDAGAAPARTACTLSEGDLPWTVHEPRPEAPSSGLLVDGKVMYLVCNGQVDRVLRDGTLTGSGVRIAGKLLDELGRTVTPDELRAGYETAVPVPLDVKGPGEGDPEGTLRLSTALDTLPPFALGQIVCTLSYVLEDGGPVRLAGPAGQVREFSCGSRLRTDPGAGPEAGNPV